MDRIKIRRWKIKENLWQINHETEFNHEKVYVSHFSIVLVTFPLGSQETEDLLKWSLKSKIVIKYLFLGKMSQNLMSWSYSKLFNSLFFWPFLFVASANDKWVIDCLSWCNMRVHCCFLSVDSIKKNLTSPFLFLPLPTNLPLFCKESCDKVCTRLSCIQNV